jgi:hypothetical protein
MRVHSGGVMRLDGCRSLADTNTTIARERRWFGCEAMTAHRDPGAREQ